MNVLLRPAYQAIERQIEPWRMRRRLARLQQPLPSTEALMRCWRAVRHGAQRASKSPLSVQLGRFRIESHNAGDLLDVFYEIFISEGYASRITSPRPFIIDCGANIGLASLYFKLHYPDSRVLAFEPNPACVTLWRQNLQGNGFTDVKLVEAAVGGSNGTAELHFNDERTLGSSIAHSAADISSTRTVPVVRLSESIDRTVELLKLDVEGAEQEVLEDLAASSALQRVVRLIVEYHHRLRSTVSDLSRFLGILESHGFTYKLVCSERGHHFDDRFQSVMIYAIRRSQ